MDTTVKILVENIRVRVKATARKVIRQTIDSVGFNTSVAYLSDKANEWLEEQWFREFDKVRTGTSHYFKDVLRDADIIFQWDNGEHPEPKWWDRKRLEDAKELADVIASGSPKLGYSTVVSERKAYGKAKGVRFDNRTYASQPDRNMVRPLAA